MCLDVWQDRLIHYVSSNGVIYLVMADDSVGRRMPFAFLADLERRVCLQYMSRRRVLGADHRFQFTAQYESDDIVSAGAHSLEEFEPELAKVSWVSIVTALDDTVADRPRS